MPVIAQIDVTSPHLEAVKKLWREHSAKLGFMPNGAFDDYAEQGTIGVALDSDGKCVGYLLYREVRTCATIAHFCVSKAFRKQGFARALLNWLIQKTKDRRGSITLSCRVDFEENATWPRLGFFPIGKKKGRAGQIQVWGMSHGHADLFTSSNNDSDIIIKAAVDANVFLDLVENRKEETMGLKADWLIPLVSICYTPELLIELAIHKDPQVVIERNREANALVRLDCTGDNYQKTEDILRPLFEGTGGSRRDQSDYRHVVRAAAANADVLLTRDDALLEKADDVYRLCGLTIIRPGELITHIDTLQREHLYQRSQVAGTNQLFLTRIVAASDDLISRFKTNEEQMHEVRDRLNLYLSNPLRFHCYQFADVNDVPIGVYVVDRTGEIFEIPFFRVDTSRKAPSITRGMMNSIVKDAVRDKRKAVLITDPNADSSASVDLGFVPVERGRLKFVLSGCISIEQAVDLISWEDPLIETIKSEVLAARTSPEAASSFEHLLWPARLIDSCLRNFIVPIQPSFAEHLFDGRLAAGKLIGADLELVLNPESAYYRAARPNILKSPARVLWYVSQSDRYTGTMSIRACSRIVEVLKEKPKPLFKRFRRLGVYEWRDVLETAGDIDTEIMAFRFDDTELLPPLEWAVFQPMLKSHGVKSTFQSPVEIASALFGEIYAACLNSTSIR